MLVIKNVAVNRGTGTVRVFIYEEGSRVGIRFPIDSRNREPLKSGIYQDFTLEETWEMANAFAAAARILGTVKAHGKELHARNDNDIPD